MSAQYFPSIEELLDILFAEVPDGVYAVDRADDPDPAKRSYSSAEFRAVCFIYGWLYTTLYDVASDKTITSATANGLSSWESELFAEAQDGSLSLEARRQNLLSKLRSSGGISLPAIRSIVAGILGPAGLSFDILPYSGQATGTGITGAWVLGVSPLGSGTYLSIRDPLYGAQQDPGDVPLDCSFNYAAAQITAQDLADIQATAYTYEVPIYGNASQATLDLLDQQLTLFEPARSTHIIRNNATGPVDPDTVVPGIYLSVVPWR